MSEHRPQRRRQMSGKQTIEACIGAWLHNKRLGYEDVTHLDEALVERLHRELGTAPFREMIAENRRLIDERYGVAEAALRVLGADA